MVTKGNSAPADPVEVELLLCCARKTIDESVRERIASLAGRVSQWDEFVSAARSGGTAPLVHRTLAGTGILPPAIEKDLRTFFGANALRGRALTSQLKQIAQILDRAGIEYIPYKGPALALAVYGEVALRQFEDLDIFLRERDVVRAGFALIAHGYQALDDTTKYPTTWPPRKRRELVHVCFTDPNGNVLIELQSRFGPDWMHCDFDYDGLWKRTQSLTIDGDAMRVLSNEDLLLVLSIHSAKHCWERLEWVSSIGELLRAAPDLDWDALIRRATSDGTRRVLFVALRLAADLVDAPLPPAVRALIAADRTAVASASSARRWLLYPALPSTGGERIVFNVRTRERRRDRIACFFSVTGQYIHVALYYPRRRNGPLRRSFAFLRRSFGRPPTNRRA